MDIHIDWLSWTVPEEPSVLSYADLYDIAKGQLRRISHEVAQSIYNGLGFKPCNSRAPYRFAMVRDDHAVSIYGGSHTGTILFELAGRGCEIIREEKVARSFIASLSERVTRMDIACDVSTGTSPTDFFRARTHQAFRSVSFMRSDTGETCYAGSAKSDRFCRVYRYSEPHPRSHLLRIEFVHRRKLAKALATSLVQSNSFAEVVAKLGNSWGWGHKDWQPGVKTDEKARVPIVSKTDENTLWWLYHQVAPAMRRLMSEGALEISEFVAYLYNDQLDMP